jgi:hypothetical protein
MIFQHTHAWILWPSPYTGRVKTMTTRPVQPGQFLYDEDGYPVGIYKGADIDRARRVYIARKRYTVQPGRGKVGLWWRPIYETGGVEVRHDAVTYTPSFNAYHSETDYYNPIRIDRRGVLNEMGFQPLKIQFVSFWEAMDVRDFDLEFVFNEGYESLSQFLSDWEAMHGKNYMGWPMKFRVVGYGEEA